MAADELLLEAASAEVSWLRLYGWTVPAVSFGYFQSHTVVPPGRPAVRRLTGGGVVDHAHDLTFSLAVSRHHPLYQLDRFASYRAVNAALLPVARSLGLTATLAEETTAVEDRRLLVCFAAPARYDVVTPAGKWCGGAQRRTAQGLLLQGSTALALTPGVPREMIAHAVAEALAALLAPHRDAWTPDAAFLARVAALAAQRYAAPAWHRKR
jgi:lipoate-protein ligase A